MTPWLRQIGAHPRILKLILDGCILALIVVLRLTLALVHKIRASESCQLSTRQKGKVRVGIQGKSHSSGARPRPS